MKQLHDKFKQYAVSGFMTVVWISGLMIAGSDNAFMPWLNFIGLGLFIGASLVMGKVLQPQQHQQQKEPLVAKPMTAGNQPQLFWHCPEKRTARYALGVLIKT